MNSVAITADTPSYWKQTGFLVLSYLGFVIANVLFITGTVFWSSLVFSNDVPVVLSISAVAALVIKLVLFVGLIFVTVHLYRGFGFWKGLGGYLLVAIVFGFIFNIAITAVAFPIF